MQLPLRLIPVPEASDASEIIEGSGKFYEILVKFYIMTRISPRKALYNKKL